MNKLTAVSMLVAVFTLSLSACGTTGKLKGTEERVETGGSLPAFAAKGKRFEQERDERCYVGFADQIHDLDIALRSAELEAKKNIVESLATELRVEGTRGQSGVDRDAVGRFFEDSQAWLTDNVKVSGATLNQTAWEKWAKFAGHDVQYFYRGYAVVHISNADYERTRMAALDSLIEKAMRERNRAAEKAARETKERLLNGQGESGE